MAARRAGLSGSLRTAWASCGIASRARMMPSAWAVSAHVRAGVSEGIDQARHGGRSHLAQGLGGAALDQVVLVSSKMGRAAGPTAGAASMTISRTAANWYRIAASGTVATSATRANADRWMRRRMSRIVTAAGGDGKRGPGEVVWRMAQAGSGADYLILLCISARKRLH
jgi:hypothetical protein